MSRSAGRMIMTTAMVGTLAFGLHLLVSANENAAQTTSSEPSQALQRGSTIDSTSEIDNSPVIATTSTKLSFHKLTPGTHTIRVRLAGNDHQPFGPQQSLRVTIPDTTSASSQRAG